MVRRGYPLKSRIFLQKFNENFENIHILMEISVNRTKVRFCTLGTKSFSKKWLGYYNFFQKKGWVLQIFPEIGWGTEDFQKKGRKMPKKIQNYVKYLQKFGHSTLGYYSIFGLGGYHPRRVLRAYVPDS